MKKPPRTCYAGRHDAPRSNSDMRYPNLNIRKDIHVPVRVFMGCQCEIKARESAKSIQPYDLAPFIKAILALVR